MLENKENLCLLFEFYGELLTKSQKEYFEEYYFLDNSLNEIAEQTNISKQAVKDSLDKATNKLLKYEEILHLVEKYLKFGALKKEKSSMDIADYSKALEKLLED